jgi:hypothetical protein
VPTTVSAGAVGHCPVPGGKTPGDSWGPTTNLPPQRSGPPPGWKPGQICHFDEFFPNTISPGGTAENPESPFTLNEGGPAGASGQFFMPPDTASVVTQLLAFQNAWQPWVEEGKWDQNGNCVDDGNGVDGCLAQPPIATATPTPSGPMCFVFQPQPVVAPGGATPGTLFNGLANVVASVKKQVNPATINAIPSGAGLSNAYTCFSVQGTVVIQPQTFDVTLEDPVPVPGTNGRHIFFVIRVTIAFDHMDWQFHDAVDNASIPPSQVPGGLCPGMPDATSAAHLYHRYSDGQPNNQYQVTASAVYGLSAVEMWDDSNGTQTRALGPADGLPPNFAVDAPVRPTTIIQEEGVPLGG